MSLTRFVKVSVLYRLGSALVPAKISDVKLDPDAGLMVRLDPPVADGWVAWNNPSLTMGLEDACGLASLAENPTDPGTGGEA